MNFSAFHPDASRVVQDRIQKLLTNDRITKLGGTAAAEKKHQIRRTDTFVKTTGAPVNNTDIPLHIGDKCLDTLNNQAYVCTVSNLSTTSTWVLLV